VLNPVLYTHSLIIYMSDCILQLSYLQKNAGNDNHIHKNSVQCVSLLCKKTTGKVGQALTLLLPLLKLYSANMAYKSYMFINTKHTVSR